MAGTVRYNMSYPPGMTDLDIELDAIRRGGRWEHDGEQYGEGLFEHFMAARKLLWPRRYRHKWTDLLYQNFIENDITMLMGCASSQKTSHVSEYLLINYWARPLETLCIITTTTIDKLETGIFGEVKMLFDSAKTIHPQLDGHLIDHKHCIATDNIEDGTVRDLRRGVACRPCYQGRQWVGLGVFAGIKQSYIFFAADELSFMEPTFLKAWPNMFSNGHLKIIGSGNPQHNADDCLGIAAEPKDGWNSLPEPDKTEVWPTRFLNGKCVNLVGTDSPNFVVKAGDIEPYPKLIGPRFAARIEHDYGLNSPEYYTQVRGVMKLSLAHSRVITREFCRQHKASDKCVWKGGGLVRILAVDPAYGGGDRCISMALEFGPGLVNENPQIGALPKNQMFIRVVAYRTLPINAKRVDVTPEDQIAQGVADDLERHNIPAQNCFYDSFGKGTVGFAFARKFGANSPIPVDAGARPSARPVRQDLYVWDEAKHQKRLKRCDEEYGKRVTELWFCVRQCIESEQMRELPEELILEGCMREYFVVQGNKKDVEPKADLRERLGKSPDLFDCLAIGVEGARERGFIIERLGTDVDSGEDGLDWLSQRVKTHEELVRSKRLARA